MHFHHTLFLISYLSKNTSSKESCSDCNEFGDEMRIRDETVVHVKRPGPKEEEQKQDS